MLNNYNFKSVFKNELNYFIKYKKSLGFKYEDEIKRLKSLDNTLVKLNIKSKKITKETFEKLVERNNKVGENYAKHYRVIKHFCKFLISNEYKNIYYKDKKFKIINNYKPKIFNDNEILLFFETLDKYKENYKNKKFYQLYYSYAIIFRLLYSCGLRSSEVLKITKENINFKENTINIIDSKRHVSRIIVLSDSMKKCLENYVNHFNIKEGLIFKNSYNKIIHYNSLRDYYKKILDLSNLNRESHLHDLRHTFCNKALNQMLENGYEENVAIVYLYKYMGHKTITETEYYLHFTDYNKKKFIDINDSFSKLLYEGVDFNE